MLKAANNNALPRRGFGLKRPSAPTVEVEPGTLPPQQALWRRIWKHPMLMHYHRLIALVVVLNVVYLNLGISIGTLWTSNGFNLVTLSNLIIANFFLGIIVRQQYVINLFFKIATSAPHSWPLSIRWILGKVYHFGGLHVGGTGVGTVWFAIFVGALTNRWLAGTENVSTSIIAVT